MALLFMSQCNGCLGHYGPPHYNVKIPFGIIWSTMALLLKLFTFVYKVLFVGNVCKLMLTPAVLTSLLNIISPIGFLFKCEINAKKKLRPKIPRNGYILYVVF